MYFDEKDPALIKVWVFLFFLDTVCLFDLNNLDFLEKFCQILVS